MRDGLQRVEHLRRFVMKPPQRRTFFSVDNIPILTVHPQIRYVCELELGTERFKFEDVANPYILAASC